MKVLLFGYGPMGQLTKQLADTKGWIISQIITDGKQEITEAVDVAIDFSVSNATVDHVEKVIEKKIPLVVGTTGWEDELSLIQSMVGKKIGLIYGANFSIGMFYLKQALQGMLQKVDQEQIDFYGVEKHHKNKKDSPSGSAKALGTIIEGSIGRRVSFASVRCGHIVGEHEIICDMPYETLEFTHKVRRREAFAFGALEAAKWITDRKGVYSFEEMLKERYETTSQNNHRFDYAF